MVLLYLSAAGNYIKKTVIRQWRLSFSATMGSLNIFIKVPSFPSTNLHVLTPSSPTMVQLSRKRKAGDSKDTGVKKRSKIAVTRKTSSGSKSSSRERLQYANLGDSKDTGVKKRSKRAVTRKTSSGSNSSSRGCLQYADLGDSKDTGVKKRSKRAVTREPSSGSNSSNRERLQYADLVSQVLEIAATPNTAEITILELMRKYSFSLATLKDLLRSVYYLSELRI